MTTTHQQTQSVNQESFKDFLFVEYENIAKAHFESLKQMALFFRYYTIFFSVPIAIAPFWNSDIKQPLISMNLFAGLFIVVGLIGISFYWITIQLKHEAVLYARTVNGIRHYFYKDQPSDLSSKILTLPLDIKRPKYHSRWNPVLMIMVVVNTVYFFLGFHFFGWFPNCYTIIGLILIAVFHFELNRRLSKDQEEKFSNLGLPTS